MNQKKAKALRRIVRKAHAGKPYRLYKEMGENTYVTEDGKRHSVTGTILLAAECLRGQYQSIKRMVKAEYRSRA